MVLALSITVLLYWRVTEPFWLDDSQVVKTCRNHVDLVLSHNGTNDYLYLNLSTKMIIERKVHPRAHLDRILLLTSAGHENMALNFHHFDGWLSFIQKLAFKTKQKKLKYFKKGNEHQLSHLFVMLSETSGDSEMSALLRPDCKWPLVDCVLPHRRFRVLGNPEGGRPRQHTRARA